MVLITAGHLDLSWAKFLEDQIKVTTLGHHLEQEAPIRETGQPHYWDQDQVGHSPMQGLLHCLDWVQVDLLRITPFSLCWV